MKSYQFTLMQDCHELIVDEMHSEIKIINAICVGGFDEYFTFYSHILVKFINETNPNSMTYETEIITWEEGVIDRSMEVIQFDYSHNIPVGCNKIKICIVNRKSVDYQANIAVGLI